MAGKLTGCWDLSVWRRTSADGTVSYPIGEHAAGLLIYRHDGNMSVQIVAADRPAIDTGDPLNGGTSDQRAAAYSTCLAYFGTFEVRQDQVIHRVAASLFPGWSGQEQVRPFSLVGDTLTLHTPTQHLPSGDVTNALIWTRRIGAGPSQS